MQNFTKELTPVKYGPSAVKLLSFKKIKNQPCFRLHWHDRMELIRLKNGTMRIGYAENATQLLPDSIYIIPPKTPHTAIAETDVEYDVIMFDVRSFYNQTPLCQHFLEAVFEGKAKFEIKTDNKETLACFERIFAISEQNTLEITSLVYKLISLLFEHCLSEFSVTSKKDTVIDSAVKFIKENFSGDITTESLASKFGYSQEHFCRKFKAETWLTPMNYLKIHRLEEAAKLLKTGKYNIREIALLCGFTDSNYFTRCFKAHFGVPPTKYIN